LLNKISRIKCMNSGIEILHCNVVAINVHHFAPFRLRRARLA
jgi:hypothetical protein